MPNQQDYQREHPEEFALPADLDTYDSGTPLRSWSAREEHDRADRAEAALAAVTAERDAAVALLRDMAGGDGRGMIAYVGTAMQQRIRDVLARIDGGQQHD